MSGRKIGIVGTCEWIDDQFGRSVIGSRVVRAMARHGLFNGRIVGSILLMQGPVLFCQRTVSQLCVHQ